MKILEKLLEKIIVPQSQEERINEVVMQVLCTINRENLNHTEKAIVVRMVEKELKEVRELELEDIVNANSI